MWKVWNKINRHSKPRGGRTERWVWGLWVLAITVNIKSIFADYGVDTAYALTTSYRHVLGDNMFAQMWEPHQTSAFLTDLLIILYQVFVPTYEGIALYMQICGTILYGIVTYVIFKRISEIVDKNLSHLICIFFFVARAKQTVFPEFSNMQIAFSVLLIFSLCNYVYKNRSFLDLLCAALFLCLEILSYPSCIITVIPIAFWLYFETTNRRDILVFLMICALAGGIYTGYYIVKLGGIGIFMNRLQVIFSADSTHSVFTKDYVHIYDVFYGMIWVLGSMFFSWIFYRIAKRNGQQKCSFLSVFGFILLITEIILLIVMSESGKDWKYAYTTIFPVTMLIGITRFKYLEHVEKGICTLCYLVSLCSFFAVSILTNLGLLTMLSYLIVGVMAAFLPIWKEHSKSVHGYRYNNGVLSVFVMCICLLTIAHRGLAIMGYSSEKGTGLVYSIENIIRCGPAKGIIAPVEKCNQARADWVDWPKYMGSEDSCLAVGGWLIDSSVYLNGKAMISNYSVIDTTSYDLTLLKYWEMNPWKQPTVIAVLGYEGVLAVPEDQWIMEWVEEHYEYVGAGTFWIFYREKGGS